MAGHAATQTLARRRSHDVSPAHRRPAAGPSAGVHHARNSRWSYLCVYSVSFRRKPLLYYRPLAVIHLIIPTPGSMLIFRPSAYHNFADYIRQLCMHGFVVVCRVAINTKFGKSSAPMLKSLYICIIVCNVTTRSGSRTEIVIDNYFYITFSNSWHTFGWAMKCEDRTMVTVVYPAFALTPSLTQGYIFVAMVSKGRICHSTKWHIRPFDTKVTTSPWVTIMIIRIYKTLYPPLLLKGHFGSTPLKISYKQSSVSTEKCSNIWKGWLTEY